MAHIIASLINTPSIELWPGGLLRARRSADARVLARAQRVLRRKRDGCYLAVQTAHGLRALVPALQREPGLDAAMRALVAASSHGPHGLRPTTLPLQGLIPRLRRLGLDPQGYAARTGLALAPEPARLAFAGFDRYARALWLIAPAAVAWQQMRTQAAREGLRLEAISGYRSHDHQLGIFERKLARGQRIEQILAVNAAPGYSEHHLGTALDIGAPGEPPAEESFERSDAFAWLTANARAFGFVLSYPRDNPHGIVYEPWHWCWRAHRAVPHASP